MKRKTLREPRSETETFSSGCTLLNCVLSGYGTGGWAECRILNVVGDRSTGKTQIAIEGCANFNIKYPDSIVRYLEIEAAFDRKYAESLGLPRKRVEFPKEPITTVEELFNELENVVGRARKTGKPAFVVVDSLDALTDEAEMGRRLSEGTFGTNKAKQMSQLFRRLNGHLSRARVTVLFVSQVRDNIGATFGERHIRAGGKALDFYASQVLWLSQIKTLERVRSKVKRAYGVLIKAKCKKNKVGPPFRDCQFPIHFNFGVEDVVAGVEWLLEVGRHDELFGSKEKAKAFIKGVGRLNAEEYAEERAAVSEAVGRVWREIEVGFLPKRSKYGG